RGGAPVPAIGASDFNFAGQDQVESRGRITLPDDHHASIESADRHAPNDALAIVTVERSEQRAGRQSLLESHLLLLGADGAVPARGQDSCCWRLGLTSE